MKKLSIVLALLIVAGCSESPTDPVEVAPEAATLAAVAPAHPPLYVHPFGLARVEAAASSSLIFDQGPSTGALHGCWSNVTAWQNFADEFNLAGGGWVKSMSIFTCFGPQSGTVHVKVLSSAEGGLLYEEDVTPDSWTASDTGYEVRFTLSVAFPAAAGVSYWIGASGNDFELGQYAVRSPGDGFMSQFSGSTYSFRTAVGDQMFQLFGPVDPQTKDDCKDGGWEQYGFINQGQCVRFIETGKDSREP